MKKIICQLLVFVMMLTLFAGCKNQDKPTDSKPADTAAADSKPSGSEPGGSEPSLKLALVVAGQFGDRSFYDSSWEGANRLAAEFPIQVTQIECGNENHTAQMKNAADKNDVVVCVGWEFYEIADVAPAYPDVKFIWIDNETEEPIPNVLNITYAQNEGSFLAGYIAAAMSKTGVVGAVGGEDQPVINDFIVGYKQGAAAYDPKVKVVTNYANSYDDPAKGKECALALADQKADVIFQIASAAGDGVFEAAKERGIYAIGVDSDQKYIDPEVIICSMKKEVGNSIYDAVKALLAGDSSKWGSTWVADMSNGYVGIGYGEEGSTQQVSDEIKAAVEEMEQKIISGEIQVDTTR
ncbi:MAG: BMP family ABC transporter substrate-binding protein [Oscillospiraceae bacterium]|nr:BMP family ABC transporter substrate-binding protein [Oscillospiraceae bacterium]